MSTPEDGEAITAAGLEALRAELEDLETNARQAISQRILAARELGDLKENAEYHIAKEDQAHLETRILRLQSRLRNAVVVEHDASSDTVVFGSTVTVFDVSSEKSNTWTIVGPTEADASKGLLSAESPVAMALMGAKAGETVTVQTPRGAREMRVESLS